MNPFLQYSPETARTMQQERIAEAALLRQARMARQAVRAERADAVARRSEPVHIPVQSVGRILRLPARAVARFRPENI